MNNNLSRILAVLLVINLAITCTLVIVLINSTNKLQEEQKRIANLIEEIEPSEEGDQTEGLAVMGGIFMSEMEGKVDEIAAELKTEITSEIESEIAGFEDSFSKYDEDIKSIASSLEELNVKMESVNNVMMSLQEILDSIKNFLNID